MATATRLSAPRGRLLGGHLRELRHDTLGFLTRCAREHGDVVPLRFGPRRGVLLCHPGHVESVLATQSRSFVKSPGYRLMGELLGNGLLTSDGELWRRERRLLKPAFHGRRVAALGDVMVGRAERMLATWRGGEVRDVYQAMMRLTLEIVADALFGADVESEVDDVRASLQVAREQFRVRTSSLLFFLPMRIPTPGNLRFRRAARRLDAIVRGIIERRRAGGRDRDDLLSLLLEARDEADAPLGDGQIRDEVMTLLLAGHETTALALSWTWYLLSQHPEAEARLLAELRTVLGGRAPTVADLPRLQYAERVISESLRLYPPAYTIGREARHDCEIGGRRITAGTIVLMSQWVLHRDPRWFDDPEAFEPDRWAGGLAARLPRFAYFPFGAGPRRCIGSELAMTEAILVLATIAQRFRLTLAPGYRVVPEPLVVLHVKDGLPMVLERRIDPASGSSRLLGS